ncbi:hypothetical protein Trydic_g14837 [Trypoxylus dichotomus]
MSVNMEMKKPIFMYEEESQAEKLARKSKETPIFPIAIAGLVAAVGYGAYRFNKRGKMSPSVFLMQLRVGAQGIAVGALTLGLAYTMINEHILKKKQ